ncbi:hypothetical protein ACFT8V_07205 [Streptomyces griseoincarnatus]|nr:hypothetical protein [Streptomyces sp. BSE7-9]
MAGIVQHHGHWARCFHLVGVGVRARREGLAVGAAVLLTALMIQA